MVSPGWQQSCKSMAVSSTMPAKATEIAGGTESTCVTSQSLSSATVDPASREKQNVSPVGSQRTVSDGSEDDASEAVTASSAAMVLAGVDAEGACGPVSGDGDRGGPPEPGR